MYDGNKQRLVRIEKFTLTERASMVNAWFWRNMLDGNKWLAFKVLLVIVAWALASTVDFNSGVR